MDKLFDNQIRSSIGNKMDGIKASDDLIARTLARINKEREETAKKSDKSSDR